MNAALSLKNQNKFYLPQLDGLRFLAFFLVFFHHANPPLEFLAPNSRFYVLSQLLHGFGWIGVDIFLCLSSFLLTVLLMIEHQTTGSIAIKQFIVRRALRIWPLYYLVIFLSFMVFPYFSFMSPTLNTNYYYLFLQQHFLPFSLFLGNFSYLYFTPTLTTSIAPLWTVSLEEQFYLFWPILLFILLPKQQKWFFFTMTLMLILSFLVRFYIIKNNIPYPTIWVFTLGRLDPFALGAFFAFLYVKKPKKSFPWIAMFLSLLLFKVVVTSTSIGAPNTIWQLLLVDLASCLLIYAAIYSDKIAALFTLKPIVWLGKISFGLYVFHDLVLRITDQFIASKMYSGTFIGWLITFSIAFLLTVICATISYYGFEKHFLKLKNRFTIIASRPI